MGGIAALAEAATFVVGIAMFATMLSDYTSGDPTPAESVAFVADNQAALRIWYVVTLIVFGLVLVPLVLAIHDRLVDRTPILARISAGFGLIWSGLVIAAGMVANVGVGTVSDLAETAPDNAESVWSALAAVLDGLGGGNEVTGGVWVLVISGAALISGVLPRILNYIGIVSGLAGLVTVAPGMEPFEMIFGVGLILWFVWLGVALIRTNTANTER
ncbi:MAG: DUF4386 family protein [Acidimicrobiales bacterium]